MTERIITRSQARRMADQLVALGAIETPSDNGIIISTPKWGEIFRTTNGTADNKYTLAHWVDDLFI